MTLPAWWPSDKPWVIADCLKIMEQMPDKCVDLIIADPPYYRVMLSDHNNKKYKWDNQWKDFRAYLDWVVIWLKESYRILKDNGSIYVFADDKNSAYTQIEMEKLGLFLENNIIWVKPNNMTIKGWRQYQCYSPITERILFASKQQRTHNLENLFYAETIKAFSPIIDYMIEQKKKVIELKDFKTSEQFNEYVNELTGTASVVSRHYFTYSQWVFPTKELYQKLQSINNEVFKRDYEDLKRDYEDLKRDYEDFKRAFYPTENFTDVWTFNISSSSDGSCGHPTQKPTAIIERIIATSCRESGIVFDPFLGSGTTLLSSRKTGRVCVGCEVDEQWVETIRKRSMQDITRLDMFGGD